MNTYFNSIRYLNIFSCLLVFGNYVKVQKFSIRELYRTRVIKIKIVFIGLQIFYVILRYFEIL